MGMYENLYFCIIGHSISMISVFSATDVSIPFLVQKSWMGCVGDMECRRMSHRGMQRQNIFILLPDCHQRIMTLKHVGSSDCLWIVL